MTIPVVRNARKNADDENETTRHCGYAFVEYAREDDMKAAYRGANGRTIEGRRVVVDAERGRAVPGWRPRRLGGGVGRGRLARPKKGRNQGSKTFRHRKTTESGGTATIGARTTERTGRAARRRRVATATATAATSGPVGPTAGGTATTASVKDTRGAGRTGTGGPGPVPGPGLRLRPGLRAELRKGRGVRPPRLGPGRGGDGYKRDRSPDGRRGGYDEYDRGNARATTGTARRRHRRPRRTRRKRGSCEPSVRFDERGLFSSSRREEIPGSNMYEGYYVMMTLTTSTFFRATLHVITSATGFTIIMTIGKSISAGPIRLTSAETDAAPDADRAEDGADGGDGFRVFLQVLHLRVGHELLKRRLRGVHRSLELGPDLLALRRDVRLSALLRYRGEAGAKASMGSGREARRASRVTPRVFARGEARWRARHASAGRRTVSFRAFSMATSEAALAFAATASAAALAFSFNAFIASVRVTVTESSRRHVATDLAHSIRIAFRRSKRF